MNTEKQQELQEYLAELTAIVNQYNPKTKFLFVIAFISFQAICITVILAIGLLWGLVLLGLVIIPLTYYLSKANNSNGLTAEKELAERACITMSSCINRYKYPEEEIYFLDYNYYGDNLRLYKEFISLFPNMKSKKLKKLASIKLSG